MKNLLLFTVLILFTLIVRGQDTFTITLMNNSLVQFCKDPVPIIISASNLDIGGTHPVEGMKVSFTGGYTQGEDFLDYLTVGGNIVSLWHANEGYLELKPNGSATPTKADYKKAIEAVVYKNLKSVPSSAVRNLSITLMDADYLSYTKHFYRFVNKPGITWRAARDEAASDKMMYFGLRGYLATITSKIENDFIKTKTTGVGWIGASDDLVEGEWRWVTGLEGTEDNKKGRLFWRGTGLQARTNPANFGPVNGYYQNWNSANDEPNNAGGENFAHITVFANDFANSYKWNDLSNTGDSSHPSSDYYPRGYLIEFGDTDGDPIVQLSAEFDLMVNSSLFKTQVISAICEGDTVRLNRHPSAVPATYSWTPQGGLNDARAASPIATPHDTTTYKVIGLFSGCKDSALFVVPVIPRPVVDFSIDSTTCVGYNFIVGYKGDADPAKSLFTWIFGGDTIVNAIDSSKINIPLGINLLKRNLVLKVTQNGCFNIHSIKNILVKPALQLWAVNSPLLCLPDSFIFTIDQPDPSIHYIWDFGDTKTGIKPVQSHRYEQPGTYSIQLTATNSDNCTNNAIIENMVQVAPVPVAAFTMSDTIVYSNKPIVTFTDASTLASSWSWNFGDSIASTAQNPIHDYTFTGRHTVFLKVSSDLNCTDSVSHQLLVAFDRLFPPNGFSPNAPNRIDRVFLLNAPGIRPVGYHFKVLSRWDDIVFEAKDEIAGWDGRMKNGSFAPAGVYVWVLDYTDSIGGTHHQTGNVSLVF